MCCCLYLYLTKYTLTYLNSKLLTYLFKSKQFISPKTSFLFNKHGCVIFSELSLQNLRLGPSIVNPEELTHKSVIRFTPMHYFQSHRCFYFWKCLDVANVFPSQRFPSMTSLIDPSLLLTICPSGFAWELPLSITSHCLQCRCLKEWTDLMTKQPWSEQVAQSRPAVLNLLKMTSALTTLFSFWW